MNEKILYNIQKPYLYKGIKIISIVRISQHHLNSLLELFVIIISNKIITGDLFQYCCAGCFGAGNFGLVCIFFVFSLFWAFWGHFKAHIVFFLCVINLTLFWHFIRTKLVKHQLKVCNHRIIQESPAQLQGRRFHQICPVQDLPAKKNTKNKIYLENCSKYFWFFFKWCKIRISHQMSINLF